MDEINESVEKKEPEITEKRDEIINKPEPVDGPDTIINEPVMIEKPDEIIQETVEGPEEIEDQSGMPEEAAADPIDEISVLDYLKFRLNPKNFGKEILPAESSPAISGNAATGKESLPDVPFFEKLLGGRELVKTRLNPLFMVLSLLLALTAQMILEPSIITRTKTTPIIGSGFYLLSAISFAAAFFSVKQDTPESTFGETRQDHVPEEKLFNDTVHFEFLGLSLVCAFLGFLLFGGNQFTFLNISVWILSLTFAGLAFSSRSIREIIADFRHSLVSACHDRFTAVFRISAWNVLWLAVFACCAAFIFHDLNAVPVDMVSDHAEKLYDVKDILDGKNPIFFTRNTGRECFQFYLTALVIRLFGTGLTFLSLKIGTALAGLFILPFVYKLGQMLANRWVGLTAMLFCGVSYWPLVIQRAALRFAFYPMFTAPALYFFIKGLKNRSRSSLIWSGIFLGIGLHGYSPFRIVPLAFVIFFIIYLLMDVKPGNRTNALGAFLCLVLFAFLVFLPLARVTLDMPEMVIYRSVSRLGETEKSFDSSPLGIFADNVWKGIVMPFWNDGSTWVHSIVFRPALEHLTASFFFLGMLFGLLRILKQRHWEDICMLISIPIFMLPSTLSLAFPAENPCLNRTAGALIPVMLFAAAGFCYTFDAISQSIRKSNPGFIGLCLISAALMGSILSNNFDLVFRRYAYEYNRSAWNTSQIGTVVKGFAESIGSYENAFVIPYPHWVDTRLVGINAGDPGKDYAFDKSLIASLPNDGSPRLFIYRDSDTEAADVVRSRYPNGVEQLHVGPYEGKNFYSYITFGSMYTGGN